MYPITKQLAAALSTLHALVAANADAVVLHGDAHPDDLNKACDDAEAALRLWETAQAPNAARGEEHFPGPVKLGRKVARFVYGDDETPIAECESMGEAPRSQELANARRVVACWNALRGVPTHVLEHAESVAIVFEDGAGDGGTFTTGLKPRAELPRFDPTGPIPIPPQ